MTHKIEAFRKIGGCHEADIELEYEKYQTDKLHVRILTPDGIRIVCASLDNDSGKIGIRILEMLVKFRSEGLFEVVVEDE